MAFNKWAKQLEMQQAKKEGVALSADGLALTVEDPTAIARRKSHFLEIQDKINRALQDIDDIYDQQMSGDSLLDDIQAELAHMENGEFKVKLTSFIHKYRTQQAQVDQIDTERTQVLMDLADWFAMDHMDDELDSVMSRSEEVNDAKFEFAKLKEINTQLTGMNQEEAGFEDLKRERDDCQGNVVKAFKTAKESARRVEMVKEAEGPKADDQQVVWKHAASEIVDMLGKVREEGKDYIAELEDKIKGLLKDGDNAMRKITRLENSLEEKKQMEKKWKEESTKQTKEKSALQSQLKKMKKEIIKLRKAQGHPQAAAALSGSALSIGGDSQSQLKESNIHELSSQLDTMQKELKGLQGKVIKLEKLLEKKDEELSNLEHDKMELLHQMKQASLRPDARHLSDQSSHSLSVTSTKPPTAEKDRSKPSVDVPKGTCVKCGGDLDAKPPPTPKRETLATRRQKDKKDTQEWEEKERKWTGELAAKNNQVANLEEHLRKAQQEIQQLKAAVAEASARKQPREAPPPKPAPETRPQVKEKPKEPQKLPPEEKVQKKAPPVNKSPPIRMPELAVVLRSPSPPPEDPIMLDQCIQTDPGLDPLSDWSKVVPQERGWYPPLPPDNWVEFDPTMPTDRRRHSIDLTMLKGAQPSEVKQETQTAATFLAKQFTRIMEGIVGFKDYVAMIVDRETTNMTRANDRLKSLLSPEELIDLQQEAQLLSGGVKGPHLTDFKKLNDMFSANLQDLSEIEKSDLSADQKAQMSMNIITTKTMAMLAEVVERLRDGINEQYQQYECIYTTLQKRPSGFLPILDEGYEDEPQLRPKRSRSHSAIRDMEREGIPQDLVERGIYGHHVDLPTEPHARLSHSDIVMKESHITGQTEDRSVNASRQLFKVSQATVPKKGRILLATPKAVQAGYDPFGNFKDIERRKTKPAPISHSKMKKRQKDLLSKRRGQSGPGQTSSAPTRQQQQPKRSPRAAGQVPEESFDGYTLGELEKRAEEFAETTASTEHHQMIETLADAKVNRRQRLPLISQTQTQESVRPQGNADTRLPPISH